MFSVPGEPAHRCLSRPVLGEPSETLPVTGRSRCAVGTQEAVNGGDGMVSGDTGG